MKISEDNYRELILSYHNLGWSFRLGGKCLHPISHFTIMIALVPTISKMVSCTSLDLNYIEEKQNLKTRSDCKMAQCLVT